MRVLPLPILRSMRVIPLPTMHSMRVLPLPILTYVPILHLQHLLPVFHLLHVPYVFVPEVVTGGLPWSPLLEGSMRGLQPTHVRMMPHTLYLARCRIHCIWHAVTHTVSDMMPHTLYLA